MAACSSRVGGSGFAPSPITSLGVDVEAYVLPQLLVAQSSSTTGHPSSPVSASVNDEETGGITVYKIGPVRKSNHESCCWRVEPSVRLQLCFYDLFFALVRRVGRSSPGNHDGSSQRGRHDAGMRRQP
jgi:hypothetical protein